MPKDKSAYIAEKKDLETRFERFRVLLDNLVRAVETQDQTSMVQAGAAAREFLDKNPA